MGFKIIDSKACTYRGLSGGNLPCSLLPLCKICCPRLKRAMTYPRASSVLYNETVLMYPIELVNGRCKTVKLPLRSASIETRSCYLHVAFYTVRRSSTLPMHHNHSPNAFHAKHVACQCVTDSSLACQVGFDFITSRFLKVAVSVRANLPLTCNLSIFQRAPWLTKVQATDRGLLQFNIKS